MPLEAEPLWTRLVELTTEAAGATPERVEAIEQQIIAFGAPAIRPLMGLCTRKLPQCPVARNLLPKFGDALIDKALEVGASSGSGFVVGCDAVSRIGISVLPRMKALIENDHTNGQDARKFGVCVLDKMGSDGVPTLIELAKSENKEAMGAALSNLSLRADPRLVPLFLAGLSHPNPGVRTLSAFGLRRNPDPRALPSLRAMVRASGREREAALSALGAQYSPDLRPVIAFPAWTDPDRLVRRTASNVLSSTRDRVAQRLGRRYYAGHYYPNMAYYEWGPRVSVAVVFLCLAAALGARVSRPLGLFVAAVLGIYWGGFATDQWIYSEAFLLGVFIPVALFVLWRTGATWPHVPLSVAWLVGQLVLPAVFSAPLFYYGDLVILLVNSIGLILAVPAVGLALRWSDEDPASLRKARRVVRDMALTFYVTYGIAFAALWGYLGF
ncbi:MAG: HEAT repeat domain-containing protein [Anaerolineaceae bacterium]